MLKEISDGFMHWNELFIEVRVERKQVLQTREGEQGSLSNRIISCSRLGLKTFESRKGSEVSN